MPKCDRAVYAAEEKLLGVSNGTKSVSNGVRIKWSILSKKMHLTAAFFKGARFIFAI